MTIAIRRVSAFLARMSSGFQDVPTPPEGTGIDRLWSAWSTHHGSTRFAPPLVRAASSWAATNPHHESGNAAATAGLTRQES